jgi:hypothetical protein
MKMSLTRKLGAAAVVAALLAPVGAQAESTSATGAGVLSTSARVDFQITIPRFVALRVGAIGAGIDMVSFAPTAAVVGTSAPIAGTGGNLGGGAVTATVLGNGGSVSLGANTTATGISNGAGSTISWTQITTASSNPSLGAPVLLDGVAAPVAVTAAGGIVNQTATWTYSYANTVVPAAGTYGGVGINDGRVTYTASLP